jgi:hypothetical protein
MRQPLPSSLLLLLLTAAACGGGDVPSDPDGGIPFPDAPAGDVDSALSLDACSIRAGVAGATAILHASDGTIVETTTTDASGTAIWDPCVADAMVTVVAKVVGGSSQWRGTTVVGVQPGDHIEVRLPGLAIVSTAKVDVPEDGSDITMVRVSAGGGCSGNSAEGATKTLEILPDCLGDDEDVVAALATGQIGTSRVYAHSGDTTIVPGGTTEVPLAAMSGWTTGLHISASATNLMGLGSVEFNVQPLRNGIPHTSTTQLASAQDGVASTYVPAPPSSFSKTRRVGASTPGLARRGIVRITDGFGEEFDLSALLPPIEGGAVDHGTPGRPLFTLAGDLSAADLGVIVSTWTNGQNGVVWFLLLPPGAATSVRFPALPAALSAVAPVDASLAEAVALRDTGSSYRDILVRGYVIGRWWSACPDLAPGDECWFTGRGFP